MERDLVDDLNACEWFLAKIRASDTYAQNVYAALCNMRWQPADMWPVLKDEYWTCSWRSAGGIVANFLNRGDYLDWYCSGMGGLAGYDDNESKKYQALGYVPESTVTDEIRTDFAQLGWHPSPWPKDDK
jgi:hypothetical protein